MTAKLVEDIKRLAKAGLIQIEISRKLRISHETVGTIMTEYGISTNKPKTHCKFPLTTIEEWGVVTAALRGEIPKKSARAFCKGKITFEEAMKR